MDGITQQKQLLLRVVSHRIESERYNATTAEVRTYVCVCKYWWCLRVFVCVSTGGVYVCCVCKYWWRVRVFVCVSTGVVYGLNKRLQIG